MFETTDPAAVREAFDGVAPVTELGEANDSNGLDITVNDETLAYDVADIATAAGIDDELKQQLADVYSAVYEDDSFVEFMENNNFIRDRTARRPCRSRDGDRPAVGLRQRPDDIEAEARPLGRGGEAAFEHPRDDGGSMPGRRPR